MSKRFPWLKLAKRHGATLPLEPPLWMGNRSNGEYWHDQTPKERRMRQLILDRAEASSRKLGVDRREFLASTAGMMTTLAVINQMGGCGDDGEPSGADGGQGGAGADAKLPFVKDSDAYLVTPEDTTCMDSDKLAGDEFIFDVQTHSFDDGEWRTKNPPYASFLKLMSGGCDEQHTEANQLDCFGQDHYARLMFGESDTTMAVISSWPAATCTSKRTNGCGLPLSNAGMRELRDTLNRAAQSQRVVNQVQIMPNDDLELQKDIMTMAFEDKDWRAVSWKAYPAWKSDTYKPSGGPAGEGYFMTDDIGLEFIEHGLKIGVKNFAIHKGLPIPGFDVEHNKPTDIGPAARMYPEANLIIYHSAISAGVSSGGGAALEKSAFDPESDSQMGLGMLLKSLWDEGLIAEDGPKGSLNVYAELGSAWSNVMRDGVAAQHFMGKLLKYLGEDHILWGTDSILGGSPQGQIEAFRLLQISPELQQMYGYPELTAERKAKIFGLNAARIYKVDAERERCKLDLNQLALHKRRLDAELGERRFTQIPPLAPRTRREFITAARIAIKKGHPGIA